MCALTDVKCYAPGILIDTEIFLVEYNIFRNNNLIAYNVLKVWFHGAVFMSSIWPLKERVLYMYKVERLK